MSQSPIATLIFKSRSYPVSFHFNILASINPVISLSLFNNHQYEVYSDVNCDVFQSFINYLFGHEVPNIKISNIEAFHLLNQEFQYEPMNQLISSKREELDELTVNLYNLKSQSIRDKSQIEEQISLNLDSYVTQKGEQLFSNFVQILYNIFNHPRRILTKFDRSYELIELHGQTNPEFYCLLPSIDFKMLTKEHQDDSIINKSAHFDMNPKNETDSLLEKIENLKKINQLLLISNEINSPDFFIKYKDFITRCCEEGDVGNLRNVVYSTFNLNFEYDSSNYTAKLITSRECRGDIVIPRSVYYKSHDYVITSMEKTFYYNDQVTSLSFAEDAEIRSISAGTFSGSSFERIEIPSTVELCNGWNENIDISAFHFAPNNPNFLWVNQNLLLKKMDPNSCVFDVAFIACPNFEEFVFPANVKEIAASLFEYTNIKRIAFSENSELQIIGASSFSKTKIKEISIPSHVKFISKYAFCDCRELRKISFTDDSELIEIGFGSFKSTAIEVFNLPPHVKIIGSRAFSSCSILRQFVVPTNSELQEIGNDVFKDTRICHIKCLNDLFEMSNTH